MRTFASVGITQMVKRQVFPRKSNLDLITAPLSRLELSVVHTCLVLYDAIAEEAGSEAVNEKFRGVLQGP